MLWTILSLWILQLHCAHVVADVYFAALLQGTLKTFQKEACDDQQVSLRCPAGTCISVLIAQYGSSTTTLRDLCPDTRTSMPIGKNSSCVSPNLMQYSLLQTVMEACHKKRQCKFHVAFKFTGDPCSGLRKYIQVAYKCRPYEFRSKMACQDESLQLTCNPHSRVAVYSASFGRTEYESVRCPQPQGVREETCLANYATETVMRLCHGKRQCSVTADTATFSNNCNRLSRTYLKIVYTCVPKTVLQEQLEDQVEEDERTEPEYDLDYDDSVDNALRDHVISESPKMTVGGGRHNSSTFFATEEVPQPPSTSLDDGFTETRSRLVLGLVFTISCGLVLLAGLLGARYYLRPRPGPPDKGLAKGYSEDTSEDVEIDLTSVTVLPSHQLATPQEVIRYKEDTPLSLGVSATSEYYYG